MQLPPLTKNSWQSQAVVGVLVAYPHQTQAEDMRYSVFFAPQVNLKTKGVESWLRLTIF